MIVFSLRSFEFQTFIQFGYLRRTTARKPEISITNSRWLYFNMRKQIALSLIEFRIRRPYNVTTEHQTTKKNHTHLAKRNEFNKKWTNSEMKIFEEFNWQNNNNQPKKNCLNWREKNYKWKNEKNNSEANKKKVYQTQNNFTHGDILKFLCM